MWKFSHSFRKALYFSHPKCFRVQQGREIVYLCSTGSPIRPKINVYLINIVKPHSINTLGEKRPSLPPDLWTQCVYFFELYNNGIIKSCWVFRQHSGHIHAHGVCSCIVARLSRPIRLIAVLWKTALQSSVTWTSVGKDEKENYILVSIHGFFFKDGNAKTHQT